MKGGELFFRTDARDEAKALVLEHHYSHRWPATPMLTITWHAPGGLFGDRGPAVAAAIFSAASGWAELTAELTRLVRLPSVCIPLSSLISAGAKELRRHDHDLVISYADPEAGHHGGVYQAASWNYSGERGASRKFIVNDEELHQRQISDRFGTCAESVVRERLDAIGVSLQIRVATPKHLYWRALNRRGKAKAKRLGLESLPYPKPGEKKP